MMGRVAPVWDADGGGGGGGGQQQGGQQQQGGGAGEWKAPEGLPPELVGKDAAETLGKILPVFTETTTRANGLRDKLATMPKAPDKPEGYAFQPSEKLAPFFKGDLAANPVLAQARTAFHKHGIPDKAFQGLIEDIYTPLIEKGVLSAYDPQAEIKTFQTAYGLDDGATTTALAEAESFAKGLFGQLQGIPAPLQEAAQREMEVFAETAGGMAVLKALAARLGENGIRVAGQGGNQNGGPLGEAELKTLSSDPRIDPANRYQADPAKRYDPELRKRYDDGYKALAAAKT